MSKRLSATFHAQQQQRLSSGGTSSLSALAVGLGSGTAMLAALSTTTSAAASGSPQTPNTSASTGSATGSSPGTALQPIMPSLRETKFYKRALVEDIEPTLRLDTAPGLSWLARRSVLTTMTEGALVIEPTPAALTSTFGRVVKPELYPSALGGENRKAPEDEQYLRRHRFRTSEATSASQQRGWYPLCRYCLGRVRSTCDFLAFLRVVKDGHRRAADDNAERAAWGESVRLREQMFWSRVGGGVLPTPAAVLCGRRGSVGVGPRLSHEGREESSTRPAGADGEATPGKVERQPQVPPVSEEGLPQTSAEAGSRTLADGTDEQGCASPSELDEADLERINAAVDSTPPHSLGQGGLEVPRLDPGDSHSDCSIDSFYPDADADEDEKDTLHSLPVAANTLPSI